MISNMKISPYRDGFWVEFYCDDEYLAKLLLQLKEARKVYVNKSIDDAVAHGDKV